MYNQATCNHLHFDHNNILVYINISSFKPSLVQTFKVDCYFINKIYKSISLIKDFEISTIYTQFIDRLLPQKIWSTLCKA